MEEIAVFKFEHTIASSGFSRDLAKRVDDYFRQRGVSRHANREMIGKTIFGFAWLAAGYLWLLTGRFSPLQVVGLYVCIGFAQLYLGLNIAHDANHGAYSKSKRLNRVLGLVFDLVGISSYMWRLMHNDAHHVFVNVQEADTALVSGAIFRFSPHDRRRWFHRYQHLYALVFYSLSTLDWVLAKDYRWLLSAQRFGNRKIVRHPPGELLTLFAGKAFYYTYMLAIPLWYGHLPWQAVVAGFVVLHLFVGLTLALIFQPNHLVEESSYPRVDEQGHIPNNYIQHILETTVDYARGNRWVYWVLGGLNLHVCHHMFPAICHVHYPALTEIVRSTAAEHGFLYRETRTLTRGFLAHLEWMKTLGRADFPSPGSPVSVSDRLPGDLA